LLKADHEKVSGIFERIEETEEADLAMRQNWFARLRNELEIHAHLEESIFYPALKQAADTRDLVFEAIEEHQEVKVLITEIEGMAVDNDEWGDRIEDLKDAVEHHVEEEENEMFDKARDVLSQEEIEDLGRQMVAEKQKQIAATAY
jgi:iron-sulfur cluster repair protein YtfE (RIC family)